MPRLFAHPTDPPAAADYRVVRADGSLERWLDPGAPGWADAWSIEWGHDRYRTGFRAAWNESALVVRFDCEDDTPWWTMTRRDERLWEEEVVEIFLDPARSGRGYVELEINPANVVCDLRVDHPWPALASDPTWNWEGLASRVVHVPGIGSGSRWCACAVLPFSGLASDADAGRCRVPPAAGDRWRFNVFRIKRPHGPSDPERDVIYAAWSVPTGPSFHDPSVFRDLVFGA